MADPRPHSLKVNALHLGGHWHVTVRASEFGPETTHGLNGTLVFREPEWQAFKRLLESDVEDVVVAIHEEDDRVQ